MRFRKKPVQIEAVQFDGTVESANTILGWIGTNGAEAERVHGSQPERGIIINTLEGGMTALPGDWIIRGVKGEFYPCKPDIFEATYEAVLPTRDDGYCCGSLASGGSCSCEPYSAVES